MTEECHELWTAPATHWGGTTLRHSDIVDGTGDYRDVLAVPLSVPLPIRARALVLVARGSLSGGSSIQLAIFRAQNPRVQINNLDRDYTLERVSEVVSYAFSGADTQSRLVLEFPRDVELRPELGPYFIGVLAQNTRLHLASTPDPGATWAFRCERITTKKMPDRVRTLNPAYPCPVIRVLSRVAMAILTGKSASLSGWGRNIEALLQNDPVETCALVRTNDGSGNPTLETWTDANGKVVKTVTYTWTGAQLDAKTVRVRYPSGDAVDLAAELTYVYTYDGSGYLTDIALTRTV